MTSATPDVFYPIVPDVRWLRRIVPLGVRTVQLRLKGADATDVERQIAESLAITDRFGCQLIVNDFWREAIVAGAKYVHLGQEDLAEADIAAIRAARMYFGVSTHSEEELANALAAEPNYVALGPVYETKLKAMAWAPQGLDRVKRWKELIRPLPLVAIGGITPDRAPQVLGAGAQSVAVITDFLTATDPEARVRTWLQWATGARANVLQHH